LYTLLLFSSVILVNPSVIERFSNAYDSTYNYMIDGSPHHWKHSDSIVPRVNIWKGSMLMIEENFITGIGLNNFNESLGQKIKIGKIQPIRAASNNLTDGQNHAHNQFLDIFAKTGLFGFLSLIFFMMIHLYFFYRSYNLSHNNIETKYLSLFGVISVVGYIFYMSTNSILSHQLSTLFMILLFIILSGMITNRLEKP
jgi:O-antigen ligase